MGLCMAGRPPVPHDNHRTRRVTPTDISDTYRTLRRDAYELLTAQRNGGPTFAGPPLLRWYFH